ncbi:MAG: hypothetical protein KatS3mg114_0348 [Planctomycetaceae bacterium]|nr:MAG: hypothetical protein KatS3mg114_0348 [Planctomycetaceae bacterium]
MVLGLRSARGKRFDTTRTNSSDRSDAKPDSHIPAADPSVRQPAAMGHWPFLMQQPTLSTTRDISRVEWGEKWPQGRRWPRECAGSPQPVRSTEAPRCAPSRDRSTEASRRVWSSTNPIANNSRGPEFLVKSGEWNEVPPSLRSDDSADIHAGPVQPVAQRLGPPVACNTNPRATPSLNSRPRSTTHDVS